MSNTHKTAGSSALKDTFPFDFQYVNNVPWERGPIFSSVKGPEYIDAFAKILNFVPSQENKISFESNIWDFNPYLEDTNSPKNVINFNRAPHELVDKLKFFVLFRISCMYKPISVSHLAHEVITVLTDVFKHTNHNHIQLVTSKDIIDFNSRRNASASVAFGYYSAMYLFFKFLSISYKMKLSVDIKELKKLLEKEAKTVNEIYEKNKTPDIPDDYFDIILNKALMVMRDKNISSNLRMVSAGIVIISQTGLRPSDFMSLKTNALRSKFLAKSQISTYYLHLKTHKASKARHPLLEFDVFATDICAEAFQIILELRKNSHMAEKSDFLVLFKRENGYYKNETLPQTTRRLTEHYEKFFINFLSDEAHIERPGIKAHFLHQVEGSWYFPDLSQYRVHCCTELYKKNVPLSYIQRYMAHLSSQMQGYYCRPKDTYQENIAFSEQVIFQIVEEDTVPLGGNMMGEKIRDDLKKVVADNHFNIYTDMDAVIKTLGDSISLRGKHGGVCIRTSCALSCAQDARTDEIHCAYNTCCNLFHLYSMVDVTYVDFQTSQEIYNKMMEVGQTFAAQKELAKMKDIIKRRLIPELNELERKITSNGVDFILDRHPSLIDVIENRRDIRNEAQRWLKQS